MINCYVDQDDFPDDGLINHNNSLIIGWEKNENSNETDQYSSSWYKFHDDFLFFFTYYLS